MAGRQTFGGLADVATWASTPISAQAAIVPGPVQCAMSVVSVLFPSELPQLADSTFQP